jgi:hypothetical protein
MGCPEDRNTYVVLCERILIRRADCRRGRRLGETTGKRKSLGRIELDGRCFEAYEDESDDGSKRFRLQSFPAISSEREAAFIRYFINEGFIERMWPRLSGRISKEAGWAFFF